ncbi:DUF6355 family natural product biosynthesis protein [Allokutzneria oryzae]|uniref:DUF6355 family natural product biosynthesis protein n=1 Tax=Allokutzneria oryzae TaxID=1378989 RepID=A0ABV5ZXB5_9PSEU
MAFRRSVAVFGASVMVAGGALFLSGPAQATPSHAVAGSPAAVDGCGFSRETTTAYWTNCTDRGQKIVIDYVWGPDQYTCSPARQKTHLSASVYVHNAWIDQSNPHC